MTTYLNKIEEHDKENMSETTTSKFTKPLFDKSLQRHTIGTTFCQVDQNVQVKRGRATDSQLDIKKRTYQNINTVEQVEPKQDTSNLDQYKRKKSILKQPVTERQQKKKKSYIGTIIFLLLIGGLAYFFLISDQSENFIEKVKKSLDKYPEHGSILQDHFGKEQAKEEIQTTEYIETNCQDIDENIVEIPIQEDEEYLIIEDTQQNNDKDLTKEPENDCQDESCHTMVSEIIIESVYNRIKTTVQENGPVSLENVDFELSEQFSDQIRLGLIYQLKKKVLQSDDMQILTGDENKLYYASK